MLRYRRPAYHCPVSTRSNRDQLQAACHWQISLHAAHVQRGTIEAHRTTDHTRRLDKDNEDYRDSEMVIDLPNTNGDQTDWSHTRSSLRASRSHVTETDQTARAFCLRLVTVRSFLSLEPKRRRCVWPGRQLLYRQTVSDDTTKHSLINTTYLIATYLKDRT